MTASEQQILNLLGLARRARQITAGEGLVLKSIRNHQAKLVFLATDAGHSTVKQAGFAKRMIELSNDAEETTK